MELAERTDLLSIRGLPYTRCDEKRRARVAGLAFHVAVYDPATATFIPAATPLTFQRTPVRPSGVRPGSPVAPSPRNTMSTLLIGCWRDGTLTITESHQIADGDQNAIDTLMREAFDATGADWGCEFDVDDHGDAVQRTYEEFIREDGAQLLDDVEGCEPTTF